MGFDLDWLTGNVDPDEVRERHLEGMNLGSRYFQPGQKLVSQGQGFIAGKGPILDAMRKRLRTSIYDQSAQTGSNLAMQMSQMGLSPGASGGQGNIISQMLKNRAGERFSGGLLDISKYGVEQGRGLVSQGKGFYDTGSQYQSGANVAGTQQLAQNKANIAGLTQQFLSPVLGMAAGGIPGMLGGAFKGAKGFFGGGGAGPQAFDIGGYNQLASGRQQQWQADNPTWDPATSEFTNFWD